MSFSPFVLVKVLVSFTPAEGMISNTNDKVPIETAKDNAMAMVYSGWDFRKSVVDGEEMGRQIAWKTCLLNVKDHVVVVPIMFKFPQYSKALL